MQNFTIQLTVMCDIIKINPVNPEHHLIELVADVLNHAGVIGYPTETVYGIGCNAFNVQPVERIIRMKQRNPNKAMILIAGDTVQVSELVTSIPEEAEKLIDNFWPGPLTIVFEASSRQKEFAFGHSRTVAIRIPDCIICLELIKETGFPLVSTSANISGQPAATSAEQVAAAFGSQLDIIVDGGPSPQNIVSTVVDITQTPPRIVRYGAISALEINTVLQID
ncbi:threonylcarbamoyl-AMP synthase [candidate division KSB1 bacterium]|nr:threonylcarbamoyl-AMP synthase [candidate division KSB1 bacterium]